MVEIFPVFRIDRCIMNVIFAIARSDQKPTPARPNGENKKAGVIGKKFGRRFQ
jgi:hypothetical protein